MSEIKQYQVTGVNRKNRQDVRVIIEAATMANAKVKAELNDVAVTDIRGVSGSKAGISAQQAGDANGPGWWWDEMSGQARLILFAAIVLGVGCVLGVIHLYGSVGEDSVLGRGLLGLLLIPFGVVGVMSRKGNSPSTGHAHKSSISSMKSWLLLILILACGVLVIAFIGKAMTDSQRQAVNVESNDVDLVDLANSITSNAERLDQVYGDQPNIRAISSPPSDPPPGFTDVQPTPEPRQTHLANAPAAHTNAPISQQQTPALRLRRWELRWDQRGNGILMIQLANHGNQSIHINKASIQPGRWGYVAQYVRPSSTLEHYIAVDREPVYVDLETSQGVLRFDLIPD